MLDELSLDGDGYCTYNRAMNFKNYYHEAPSKPMNRVLQRYNNEDHKTALWNAFVDCGYDGVTDDDFSILPRLIPASYFPTIEKTCKDITEFLLKVISLPEAEVKAIVPEGPLRNYLIQELKVLKHAPKRLTGSFRFDMAIVGAPTTNNPPKLLEVNEIGFDGLARSNLFQDTLMTLIPELKKKAIALDTAGAEVRNMRRLGKEIVRLQYDCYNWDEEVLQDRATQMGLKLYLASPTQYNSKINHKDFPKLLREPFSFKNGRARMGKIHPDAFNMSFAFTLSDLKRDHDLYAQMIRSKTPQYGPFITSLIATKTVLMLLHDKGLRRKLLGGDRYLAEAILPAFSLKGNVEQVKEHFADYVIKHTDGCGGEQVFMDQELLKCIKKTPAKKHHEWVIQQKTLLNTIDVNGILSRKKRVISDLGVFIHYDWQDGKFTNFEVGGLMCRATNKGLKVNVSSGGLQVAVMLEKGK
jgi:hypothetical protein